MNRHAVVHAVLTILTFGIYNAYVDHQLRQEELKVLEAEIKVNNLASRIKDLTPFLPPLPKDT